jgi:hypothetical protein
MRIIRAQMKPAYDRILLMNSLQGLFQHNRCKADTAAHLR